MKKNSPHTNAMLMLRDPKAKKIMAAAMLFAGMFLASCSKTPTADFTLDKSEYTAGETVKCTNKSQSATAYKWMFPDGQTSANTNVNYILNENTPAGTYTIKLEAKNNKGKTDEGQKSFSVKAATGQLTVWTSRTSANGGQINVKIDNAAYGSVTQYYNSVPSCGSNGCVTANLSVGSHSIYATDGALEWNGTINVQKDKCSTFQLQ